MTAISKPQISHVNLLEMRTALCFHLFLNRCRQHHLHRLILVLDLILLSLRNLIPLTHSTGVEEGNGHQQLEVGIVPGHPLATLLYHHLLFPEQ
jgi:hypothetical protein